MGQVGRERVLARATSSLIDTYSVLNIYMIRVLMLLISLECPEADKNKTSEGQGDSGQDAMAARRNQMSHFLRGNEKEKGFRRQEICIMNDF